VTLRTPAASGDTNDRVPVTTRLSLRNRAHAVAYALREGYI
jgi:hypothetical protein